jgi:hypothetical protein
MCERAGRGGEGEEGGGEGERRKSVFELDVNSEPHEKSER